MITAHPGTEGTNGMTTRDFTEQDMLAVASLFETVVAHLGYPVGMGIAPSSDLCQRFACEVLNILSGKQP